MSTNAPIVSVLMPVFNAGAYLNAAIRSIVQQTFKDFELIVVDDGSTDCTSRVLSKQRDTRIRVVRQENAGLTVSLNRAISLSRGKFIARMDGDDLSLPDRFAAQLDFLEKNRDVVAVGGQVQLIDAFGAFLSANPRKLTHDEILDELMTGRGDAIVHPAAMFRRCAIEKVGGYDEGYRTAQDLDLYLRIAECGKLANIEHYVLMYRCHPASTNLSKLSLQIQNTNNIVQAAQQRMGVACRPVIYEQECRQSDFERQHSWGWKTLQNGYRYAALRHALSVLKMRPCSRAGWKLLACVCRGY